MSESLIDRIQEFAQSQGQTKHATVSDALIEQTKDALGFRIPELLKACYTKV